MFMLNVLVPRGNQTHMPGIASAMLYQLSHMGQQSCEALVPLLPVFQQQIYAREQTKSHCRQSGVHLMFACLSVSNDSLSHRICIHLNQL